MKRNKEARWVDNVGCQKAMIEWVWRSKGAGVEECRVSS